jgi:hypothetical protein
MTASASTAPAPVDQPARDPRRSQSTVGWAADAARTI